MTKQSHGKFSDFLIQEIIVIPLISNANFILCQLVTSNCLVKESLDCPGGSHRVRISTECIY